MTNHLNSLLDRVGKTDAALARELRAQIEGLAKRREFGLNFERHEPETVALPLTSGTYVRFREI